MKKLPYLFLILFIGALHTCLAQECKSGCDAGLSTCANIDYQVYVPPNSSLAANESTASYLIEFFSTSKVVPDSCRSVLFLAICHTYHPACSSSEPPSPILPCSQMCYDLLTQCGQFLELTPSPLVDLLDCNNTARYSSDPTQCSTLNNSKPLCTPEKPPSSGSCRLFNSTQAPHFGDICAPYVPTTIYVPNNSTNIITDMDYWAYNTGKNSQIWQLVAPIVPLICVQYILSTKCALFFPPCLEIDTTYVGLQTCKSFCNYSIHEVCGQFLYEAGLGDVLVPICDLFPDADVYSFNLSNGTQVTTSCRANTSSIFPLQPYANFTTPTYGACPFGTGKKMNPSLYEPACGLSCPDESYSLNEWHSVILITRIGAGISVACMIILIGVYLLSKERRQFPFTLHLNQFVATFFFCASFLIGGLHAEQTVWCDDKGTNATQSSNIWCAIQGTCFIFFGSAITSWSTSNAYVVYYIVVMQRYNPEATKLLKKNVYRFYLFSWGIPLIFTIAAITTKKIGYGPPLAWCFMDFTAFTSGVLSPDYILFYLPNVAKLILSSIMFCRSLAVIILMRRTHRKYSTPNADQKLFSVQIRCLVFIVVNFIICFTLFEWRIKIQLDNKNRQVGLSWIYCKIATQLIKGYTGDCPGSVNPARINYPHTIFESVLLSGIGVLIFMAFGSDLNLLSYLLSIFKLIRARKWQKLGMLVKNGVQHQKMGKQ